MSEALKLIRFVYQGWAKARSEVQRHDYREFERCDGACTALSTVGFELFAKETGERDLEKFKVWMAKTE